MLGCDILRCDDGCGALDLAAMAAMYMTRLPLYRVGPSNESAVCRLGCTEYATVRARSCLGSSQ